VRSWPNYGLNLLRKCISGIAGSGTVGDVAKGKAVTDRPAERDQFGFAAAYSAATGY
jgi:hypothetical protein